MVTEDESTEEYIPDPDSDAETLRELTAGIVLMGIIGAVLILITGISRIALWCYCIGICVAIIWAVHMRRGIRAAFSLSEGDAIAKMRLNAIIRYLIALAFMMGIYYRLSDSERVYAVGYIAGIFMLKAGAYLQPSIHKVFVYLGLSKPYPEGKALEDECIAADIQVSEETEA